MVKMIEGLGAGPTDQVIKFTEENLRVKLPREFIECIKQCDQGVPENSCFEIIHKEGQKEIEAIGAFISFSPQDKNNILRNYLTMPPYFPRHLLPFADVGNGDLICFDYSIGGFEDLDPPIVYWIHDAEEGKEIADVAINFKEFLGKLRPSSD